MLESLILILVDRFPELANSSFTLLITGWDSVAVDVDRQFIFKFPRDDESADALRREAAMLSVVRSRVTLPVPNLVFYDQPRPFSRHIRLPGDHLETIQYEQLDESAKHRLAGDIARFYAELHAIDPAPLLAAGTLPIDPWPSTDFIRTGIEARLPESLLPSANRILDAWMQLGTDPYGICYGFFDGHGWNMAFDHTTQTLMGIYDFGDAGFGDIHQEFIYTDFISPELTGRVITHYEQLTNRLIDRQRVTILSGLLRLVELADLGDDAEHAETVYQSAVSWLSAHRAYR